MKKSREIAELAKALIAAQAEMPKVEKKSVNPFFKSKYADLATVMEAAIPVLTKHGLSVSQLVDQDGLTTVLMHESGQYLRSTMPLYLKSQDPQGQGSAITYARRYAFMAAIGVVADEDDDGNAASQPAVTKREYAKPSPDKPISQKQLQTIAGMMTKTKYGSLAGYESQTGMDVSRFNAAQASDLIAKLIETSAAQTVEDAKEWE